MNILKCRLFSLTSLTLALLLPSGCKEKLAPPTVPPTVTIGVTPYQDTTLMLYGIRNGTFERKGIHLISKDTNWNDQIEFVAGGGCDIAMATLDEVIAKTENLSKVGRPVVFLMPAWLFEGMIFVTRGDVKSFTELKATMPLDAARRAFLAQLKGKLIAVPEGSVYEQALRNFIKAAGEDPASFTFVNAQLEAGINGLRDPKVVLAAAGIVQRLEAKRRGLKIGLDTSDLGVIVLTGFIARRDFLEQHPDRVAAFFCGWYESANAALNDMKGNYAIVNAYVDGRGAKAPTFDDFTTALSYQKIARTPKQARAMFLDPKSPVYWEIAWNAATSDLMSSGKLQRQPSRDTFAGTRVSQVVEQRCR